MADFLWMVPVNGCTEARAEFTLYLLRIYSVFTPHSRDLAASGGRGAGRPPP